MVRFWLTFGLLFPSLLMGVTLRVALPAPLEPEQRPWQLAVADGLVSFSAEGALKPGLAASWTVSPDGRSWTFVLRDARWSDGSAITSQDFANAWKRAGVTAKITPEPKGFTAVFASPVPDVAVLTGADYLLWPEAGRGCGPFLIETRSPEGAAVVKNKAFREAKLILLDRVEFRLARTVAETRALFRDGLVDWAPLPGGPGTPRPASSRSLVTSPGWGLVYAWLNPHSPRLGDGEYRLNLSRAVDRTLLGKELRGPLLLPATGLVPGVTVPLSAPSRWYGPLPEPKLSLLYPQGETYKALADGLADAWTQNFGLKVETRGAPWAEVTAARKAGRADVVLGSWLGDYPAPGAFLALGEATVLPLFTYANAHLIDLRRWKGWVPNAVDVHPWQGVTRAR